MLIDGKQLRLNIEKNLGSSKRCILYSAFYSEIAADWLVKHRALNAATKLMIRGLPSDFLDGASSLDALKKAVLNGIEVKLSSALHAKVYVFDDVLFASSANLTGRGIALFENHNIEFGLKSSIYENDLELVDNLWKQGVNIDMRLLEKMEIHLNTLKSSTTNQSTPIEWPIDLFDENRDLYVSDFPIDSIETDIRWRNKEALISTKAYDWIFTSVKEKGWKSFGELSKELHNSVYDDPVPYRKDIKLILANLLKLISELDDNLCVERPRHRQIVRLNY